MRAWIDIDNPPQVQYLSPFVRFLNERGAPPPVVTVRDYQSTVALVRARAIDAAVFGHAVGRGKLGKVRQTVGRALALRRHLLRQRPRPAFLISSSRSSALAACLMRLPAFVFCDYEHAELGTYRSLGSALMFPSVIGSEFFRRRGFPEKRLMPFAGLKEDISFAYFDYEEVAPLRFTDSNDAVVVLLRPPATSSHYYRDASADLYDGILRELAARPDVLVVLSPRYPEQAAQVAGMEWRRRPVVLDNKADFAALLKGVDVVISCGGTMLREAPYLGARAVSIFQGPRGAVDQHLADAGHLTFVGSLEQFRSLRLAKKDQAPALVPAKELIGAIVDEIGARIGR